MFCKLPEAKVVCGVLFCSDQDVLLDKIIF